MGMYTEVFVTGSMHGAPERALELLEYLYTGVRCGTMYSDHEFFSQRMHESVVMGGSPFYFENPCGHMHRLAFEEIGDHTCFSSLAHLKNDHWEVELFFDWLDSVPGCRYFGYHRHEDTPLDVRIRRKGEELNALR